MLHLAVLGYAHLADEPEALLPFQCAPRQVVMAKLQVIEQKDNPLLASTEPFDFDAADAPEEEEVPAEPEESPAEVVVAEKAFEPEVAPEPEPSLDPEPEAQAPEPVEVASKPEEAPSPEAVVEDKDPDSEAPEVNAALAQRDSGQADHNGSAPPGRGETGAPQASSGSSSATDDSASASSRPRSNRGRADQNKLNHQYGMVLYRQINRAKTYPKFARRAGIEGRVLLAITVDSQGTILAVKIHKSSGHVTLDESALATIRGLNRFPVPPSGLTWQRKIFELPMSYSLN